MMGAIMLALETQVVARTAADGSIRVTGDGLLLFVSILGMAVCLIIAVFSSDDR